MLHIRTDYYNQFDWDETKHIVQNEFQFLLYVAVGTFINLFQKSAKLSILFYQYGCGGTISQYYTLYYSLMVP